MGLVTILQSFARSRRNDVEVGQAVVDKGGGDLITGDSFSAAGDDSHPLPGDYAAVIATPRSGSAVVVGYADPMNDAETKPGEKRIYSRDPDDDNAVAAQVHLMNDGTIVIANDEGVVSQLGDGSYKIETPNAVVEITVGGNVSVVAGGVIKLKGPQATVELGIDGAISASNSTGSYDLKTNGAFNANGVIIDAAGAVAIPVSLKVGGIEVFGHTHLAGTPPDNTGPMV